MNEYSKLARSQFYAMKEEWLDDDRHCVGGENKESYEVDGAKFKIEVDGCWEKSDWWDYTVIDKDGNVIEAGSSH